MLQDIIASALQQAKQFGADQAEISLGHSVGLQAAVRLGEVDMVEHHLDRGMGITVYIDHRKGSASTTDLSPAAVTRAVRMACDIARFIEQDTCAGLADANLMADNLIDLDVYHPWDCDASNLIDIARECEDAARAYDNRITNSEGAGASTHTSTSLYANSHGFFGETQQTSHSIGCAVIASSAASMQVDAWDSTACHRADLEQAAHIGTKAAQRALAKLNPKPIKTGAYPILFAPSMARSLVGSFLSAINGGSQYRKTSFLLDMLGQPIFPTRVDISENPRLPRELGSACFDSEGVARTNRPLVEQGQLKSYALNSYSARKLNMQTTGNAGGLRNVRISSDDMDEQALLKTMGRGIWVTDMIGSGCNPVTGDYSRGAVGFLVEAGEVVHAVEEITVAGNLRDVFMDLQSIGTDIDRRGNVHTGSWLVGSMTVAAN